MKARLRLSIAALFVVLLVAAAPPPLNKVTVHGQGRGQAAKDDGGRAAPPGPTGWYQRPPEAGDYEDAIVFPNMERPAALAGYLPGRRDLAAICSGQTRLYADTLAAEKRGLAELLAEKPDALDPDILQVPRFYQKVGDLSAYDGDMDAAISNLENSYRLVKENSDIFPRSREIALFLEEQIGVAYMRRGEVRNCQVNHNAEMCILPLSVLARHKLTDSSEKAIEYFKKHLETNPENLEVRWLLNVAYMTLGKYPGEVPKEQLIPPAVFESKEDIGRFTDVASPAGLNVIGNAGGTVADDFDNDGLLDIMMSSSDPCQPLHYYHNNGDGTFSDWANRAKLSEQMGGLNIVQTDYNNDGRLDLFVMRGGWDYPVYNSLLRNNSDGTFTDVTVQSGLDDGPHRTHTAVWGDFDSDGYVDLFVGHELEPSKLFRNKGDGTFEDVSHSAGVDRVAFTKGASWGDYDVDGYPDLYVSNYAGENFLYHNNGDRTFTEVGKKLHVEKPLMSFPCWFFDYDNDGFPDILVANFVPTVTEVVRGFLKLPRHAETMKLYRNTGHGTFEDVTQAVGLDRVIPAMGANFGDLDNDGYLDFYLGTGSPSYAALVPNFMFRNHGGQYFVDVTTSTGTGHLQKGHGVAFSDVNNDGNQDVIVNLGGAAAGDQYNKVLFANPGHANNWLSVKLAGVKTNRAAIGARIKVVLEDGAGGEAIRYREVTSGGSFGASSLTQEIGLGKAARIRTLDIFWPASKTRQVFRNVAVNQFIEVKEFAESYAKRQVRSFRFGPDGAKPMPHEHPND